MGPLNVYYDINSDKNRKAKSLTGYHPNMAVDWSDLRPELLETIARKLTVLGDYIRFRAVCVNWGSSTPKTPKHLPCQLPWLMLPHNRYNLSSCRALYSLTDNKVYALNLPEASHRRRLCGSSHGWLIILEESPAIFIINLLTRAKINLLPLSAFPNVIDFNFSDVGREYKLRDPDGDVYTRNLKEMRDSFVKKMILSSSPLNDSNYIAVAILNQTGDLAYLNNGEPFWRFIHEAHSYCEDVIYYNGLFYAVNKFGGIAVCDLQGDSPRVSFIDTPRHTVGDMEYLVNWMDELLLVTRYLELEFDVYLDIAYKTSEFRVFRLDLSGPKWERVTSLDDYSEANYDGGSGDHDLGVYYLEDGSIEALLGFPRNSQTGFLCSPPIWVSPNLC
ncbi:unnamed protein product [Ilex paraguariensis]|uniref:KIB1-4 beta-propeller domain-containing protein n=1 Tax=Ilex paraguariensis TaxID=185542 RepID=A0ABC8V3J1_9AQUA